MPSKTKLVSSVMPNLDALLTAKIVPESDQGLFGAYKLHPSTVDDINAWVDQQGLKNTIPSEEFHVTTVYSPDPIMTAPVKRETQAKFLRFDILGKPGEPGTLVAILDCPLLHNLFVRRLDEGAQWNFPTYIPHISIAKEVTPAQLDELNQHAPWQFPIQLSHEELSPLDLDFKYETKAELEVAVNLDDYKPDIATLHTLRIKDKAVVWYRIIDNKILEISSIRNIGTRNTGNASAALKALCAIADEHHLSMRLIASPLNVNTNVGGLLRLFSRFGFVPTGQCMNLAQHPWMKRPAITDVKAIEAAIREAHFTRRVYNVAASMLQSSEDTGLIGYAKRELALLRKGKPADEMQAMMELDLLDIIRKFGEQGHSGFSAAYAIGILEDLLRYKPLSPLTGDDSEWMAVAEEWGENGERGTLYQNKRAYHVFKDPNGAYDIDGRIFREPSGACFTSRESRVYITFPYTPKSEYVDRLASPDWESSNGRTAMLALDRMLDPAYVARDTNVFGVLYNNVPRWPITTDEANIFAYQKAVIDSVRALNLGATLADADVALLTTICQTPQYMDDYDTQIEFIVHALALRLKEEEYFQESLKEITDGQSPLATNPVPAVIDGNGAMVEPAPGVIMGPQLITSSVKRGRKKKDTNDAGHFDAFPHRDDDNLEDHIHKDFPPDPVLHAMTRKELDRLSSKYLVGRVSIAYESEAKYTNDDVMAMAAWRKILFYTKHWNTESLEDYLKRWHELSMAAEARHIVMHEFGHCLFKEVINKIGTHPAWNIVLKHAQTDRHDSGISNAVSVSPYAMENTSEFVAEAFVTYETGKHSHNINPENPKDTDFMQGGVTVANAMWNELLAAMRNAGKPAAVHAMDRVVASLVL